MPGTVTETSTTVQSYTGMVCPRERDHYGTPSVSGTSTFQKLTIKQGASTSGVHLPNVQNKACTFEALAITSANSLSPGLLDRSGQPSSVAAVVGAAAAAPTAMYRPNFSEAFQRASASTHAPPALFSLPCSLSSGPTDLSMKNKPLLAHKLNPAEMTAVRQLITGFRESAAFLLRSADELEQLLRKH